jgi:hypothetical protein
MVEVLLPIITLGLVGELVLRKIIATKYIFYGASRRSLAGL